MWIGFRPALVAGAIRGGSLRAFYLLDRQVEAEVALGRQLFRPAKDRQSWPAWANESGARAGRCKESIDAAQSTAQLVSL